MRKFVSILLVAGIIIFLSCSNFKEEAKLVFKHLNLLYEISISKSKITQQVWYAAIYNHKYALSNSDNFDEVVRIWGELDNKDKANFYKDLLRYSIPTLQAQQLDLDVKHENSFKVLQSKPMTPEELKAFNDVLEKMV